MNKTVILSHWRFVILFLCTICVLMCLYAFKDGYNTHDLQTYNLRGNVKSVEAYVYDPISENKYCSEYLEFDREGKLIVNSDITIKRNSEGYIIMLDGGFDGEEYEYDGNWTVKSIRTWSTSTRTERIIKFDKNNNPLESELYGEPDFELEGKDTPSDKLKYRYYETDSHGNWIARYVKKSGTPSNPYGENREWTEERIIEYY